MAKGGLLAALAALLTISTVSVAAEFVPDSGNRELSGNSWLLLPHRWLTPGSSRRTFRQ